MQEPTIRIKLEISNRGIVFFIDKVFHHNDMFFATQSYTEVAHSTTEFGNLFSLWFSVSSLCLSVKLFAIF